MRFYNHQHQYDCGIDLHVKTMYVCAAEGIAFILGHALAMKAIHGGTAKHDTIDSHNIAVLLRGGLLPQAYAIRRRCDRRRIDSAAAKLEPQSVLGPLPTSGLTPPLETKTALKGTGGLLVSVVGSGPLLAQDRDRSLDRIILALQQPSPIVRSVAPFESAAPKTVSCSNVSSRERDL